MQQVKSGDTILVHYVGRLKNGEVFDSSEGLEPLQFTVGNEEVINGFDKAVIDMEPGQKKTVDIPVEDAYLERSQEALLSVSRSDFAADESPEIGQQVEIENEEGHMFPAIVVEVLDDHVILDANHPLAGEDLTFDITLVKIL